MGTTVNTQDSIIRVIVSGRLDITTVKEFEVALQPLLIKEKADIVLDCAGMTYINSSGLRLFIVLLKAVKANKGTLAIENMQANVHSIFDMTGFSNLFTIL